MTCERYTADKKEQWNGFVAEAKNPLFMHNRNYMDYHSDRFADHSLMFYEEDKLTALLPANEKEGVLYSHGGLTYGGLILGMNAKQHTVMECFDCLLTYLKNRGFEKLVYKAVPHVYHLQPAEEDLFALKYNGAVLTDVSASTVIDLKAPIKMPKGRKAQISRAKREGVDVVCTSDKKDYEAFLELENEVLESRHNKHAVHTADELYMLHERFPDNIKLYAGKLAGKLIAGTVIYIYDDVVHTQYMAADEDARRIGALDLCVATVMEEYAADHKWLDFGISTEDGGSYLNEGLIAQKEGFGGRTNIYTVWELKIQS
ncbi:MAG: GNAT family N-acetyltransferase [Lachnospiraceae bacterium]|nr:GNAT family N-acetyltransferase [Lachnospiraceae bacterium]